MCGLPPISYTVPSSLHEGILELFKERLALAPEVLDRLGNVEVPDHDGLQLGDPTNTQLLPEHRADLVVTLLHGGVPTLAIVVEVQLSVDAVKDRTWPLYGAAASARYDCPAIVVVVTPSARVARAASVPIAMGGRSLFVPEVLGPGTLPRHPSFTLSAEIAVLSALAYRDPATILEVLDALEGVDDSRGELYYDLIAKALPAATRRRMTDMPLPENREARHKELSRRLREEMRDEAREEGRIEGERGGTAKAILSVLSVRSVVVGDAERRRILACSDDALLQRWLERAITADDVSQLFD